MYQNTFYCAVIDKEILTLQQELQELWLYDLP